MKTAQKKTRKLALGRETLRTLGKELTRVHGGETAWCKLSRVWTQDTICITETQTLP